MATIQLIVNRSTDPAFNLALEEYALSSMNRDVIMLWRNAASVIIGRNQNAVEEMDMDYVEKNGITVIRRQSGGGAVFHDLGNINFTVIHALGQNDFSNYEKFTAPICAFLQSLGVNAKLEGRNDLTIDGMKFSGNAQAVRGGRIMHHGTILYNADFGHLTNALRPKPAKIESKGIKSIRSRVTNVAEHMSDPMPVEEFFDQLAEWFRRESDGEYTLTGYDITEARKLVDEKYSTWEWNVGKSPAYNLEKTASYPFGNVDIRLSVSNGVMDEVHIFGDFFGVLDKVGLEQALTGVRHSRGAILEVIGGSDLGRYIHGMSHDQLLDLLCG